MTTPEVVNERRHSSDSNSYVRRLARFLLRPFVGTALSPNHLTTLRIGTGAAACAAFAVGAREWTVLAGVLWVISTFVDRTDGEFARMSGKSTRFGHLCDYWGDVALNALVFLGIGIGLRQSFLGPWAVALGTLAAGGVALAAVLAERLEQDIERKSYGAPRGFDFDDILFLLGPVAWLDGLDYLLVGAAGGGPAVAALIGLRLRKQLARKKRRTERPDA
jgi:phosphatidylglycerophosphate synthase